IYVYIFFSSRRRHTRFSRDWSSDVCSSDLQAAGWLFRTLFAEKDAAKLLTEEYKEALKTDIFKAAEIVLEHEKQIINKLFEKGRSEERRVGKECRSRQYTVY